jgi:hypothetical protein
LTTPTEMDEMQWIASVNVVRDTNCPSLATGKRSTKV